MAIKQRNLNQAPIGIFDSGVGGLTVVNAIQKQLPGENLIYLGDTARTPYGSKAGETVTRFTLEGATYLARLGIKVLVVACNTASAYAWPALRRRFSFPILEVIQPGASAALQQTPHGPIGVIGTRATIQSNIYPRSIHGLQRKCRVLSQPCPLLVPLVEEGWLKQVVTWQILQQYLHPLLRQGIHGLILGCTHYPALKPAIRRICGSKVKIIDSAETLAHELAMTLEKQGLTCRRKQHGKLRFLVTDAPEKFIQVGSKILGWRVAPVQRVVL